MISRTLIFIFCACLLAACANHSTFALQELNDYDAINIREYGISISVKTFLNAKELQNYFATDLVRKGLLPVQVHILNEADSDIGIAVENISLFSPDKIEIAAAESSDAYKNSKSGYGATPIHIIAFGALGFIGSIGNVTDSNLKLDSDLQSKLLKSGIVQRHRYIDGVVFFPIQKNTRNLAGWHLSIMVYHREKRETFCIKVPL